MKDNDFALKHLIFFAAGDGRDVNAVNEAGRTALRQNDSTSVQILAQLVKEGKITIGESKFSRGSMLELKVPRNESPQRIYWEADNFSYSYPLGKVNLKYYLTEKDKNERLKKAKKMMRVLRSLQFLHVTSMSIKLLFASTNQFISQRPELMYI